MSLEDLVSKGKEESDVTTDNELSSEDGLTESLKLLVERDNPMSDAAKKALERL